MKSKMILLFVLSILAGHGGLQARAQTPEPQAAHWTQWCNVDRFHRYISLVERVHPRVTELDYSLYLLPLKVAAGYTIAYYSELGPSNPTTIREMKAIVRLVNSNQAYFETLLTIPDCFNDAVDLFAMTAALEHEL